MRKSRQYPRDYVSGSKDYIDSLRFYVYLLYCPIKKQVRYVGQTQGSLYYRLSLHQQEATAHGRTPKTQWLRELRQMGTMPLIRRIARFATRQEAKDYEIRLIARLCLRRDPFNIEGTPADKRRKKWSGDYQRAYQQY